MVLCFALAFYCKRRKDLTLAYSVVLLIHREFRVNGLVNVPVHQQNERAHQHKSIPKAWSIERTLLGVLPDHVTNSASRISVLELIQNAGFRCERMCC